MLEEEGEEVGGVGRGLGGGGGGTVEGGEEEEGGFGGLVRQGDPTGYGGGG